MNPLNESELKARTKRFGLRVMKLVDALPNTMAGVSDREPTRALRHVGSRCAGRGVRD